MYEIRLINGRFSLITFAGGLICCGNISTRKEKIHYKKVKSFFRLFAKALHSALYKLVHLTIVHLVLFYVLLTLKNEH